MHRMVQTLISLSIVSVLLACTSALAGSSPTGANWPQFRGPGSQGISDEKGLPTQWSGSKNVQWKTPLPGSGHSSPIVWGNKIFLTTSIEGPVVPGHKAPKHMIGNEEFTHPDWVGSDHSYTFKVICIDADKGKVLWERTPYEGPVFD